MTQNYTRPPTMLSNKLIFFKKNLPLTYDDYRKYGLDTNEYLKVSVAQWLDPPILSETFKIQMVLPFPTLS